MTQININDPKDVVYLLTWDWVYGTNTKTVELGSYACKTKKRFDEEVRMVKADPEYHNVKAYEMRAVQVKI